MRIDRTKFIAWTLGMSGAACNTGPGPAVASGVVEIPAQPPQPADAGAPAPQHTKDDELLRASPTAEGGDDDDDGASVDLEEVDGCGFVDPSSVARPKAACNDDQGTAASCATMKTCTGFPFPKSKCEAYRKSFKPRIAQRAVACLAKLSAKQVCDACTTYRCGDLALKGACPDPAVDPICAQLATRCKSMSVADCRLYLSGMSTAGRASMIKCLSSSSGCGFGIYSCAESI